MQNEEKHTRSKNVSAIEASAFIYLLTPARVTVIENKSTHDPMVKKKNNCGDTVCHEFNALRFGIGRVAQLKEYWKRKKKELTKVLAEKKREIRGTGGGPSEVTILHFLQKMSDLIPRVYLDAPSELQKSLRFTSQSACTCCHHRREHSRRLFRGRTIFSVIFRAISR